MQNPQVEIRLELIVHPEHLSVAVFNTSSRELRLWELHNSWGWYSFSFELNSESGEPVQVIERKAREWTKNGPTYFVLHPGASREIEFNIKDGWWEVDEGLARWKDGPVRLRAKLHNDPSPEAEKYGVFIGTVFSDWAVSIPPHSWLFTANGAVNPDR